MSSKHASSVIRSLTKNMFDKKHIAYGRIIDHWKDIVGEKMFEKAQPAAIRYRKNKEKQIVATLKIYTDGGNAMRLSYQKMLILEKINQLIGKPKFVDIIIEQFPVAIDNNKNTKTKQSKQRFSGDIEKTIQDIDDEDLKERLRNFLESANR